jgi:hypothetical protein
VFSEVAHDEIEDDTLPPADETYISAEALELFQSYEIPIQIPSEEVCTNGNTIIINPRVEKESQSPQQRPSSADALDLQHIQGVASEFGRRQDDFASGVFEKIGFAATSQTRTRPGISSVVDEVVPTQTSPLPERSSIYEGSSA